MLTITNPIVPTTVDLLTGKRNRDDAFNSDVEEDTNATVTPPVHSWTKLIQRVAKDVWGIDKLYPYQIRIIEALISRATPLERRLLLVIKTGGGKSAVVQVTATIMMGLHIIIVPLLALGADQVSKGNSAIVHDRCGRERFRQSI